MNGNDFDFLVNETLRLNEGSPDQKALENLVEEESFDNLSKALEEESSGSALISGAPQSNSGIIYRLEKASALLKLRCIESSSLIEDWQGIQAMEKTQDRIGFFETESFADAVTVARNFNSFKLLNQPSLDYQSYAFNKLWWGILSENKLTISFGKIPAKSDVQIYDLGPLGDQSLAKYYFEIMNKYLIEDLGFVTSEEKDKKFSWEFEGTEIPKKLLGLFWGKEDFDFSAFFTEFKSENKVEEIEYLSFRQYLNELELFREFWQKISPHFNNSHNLLS